jgi:hypothetical protein
VVTDEAEEVHFPANEDLGIGHAPASHQDGRSKPSVRPMAGKLTGSILIGLERAG